MKSGKRGNLHYNQLGWNLFFFFYQSEEYHGKGQKIMNTASFLEDQAVASFVVNSALSLPLLPHPTQPGPEQAGTPEHHSPGAAVHDTMS